METSHRHLLRAEEGTWLNIDGFHMGIVATTPGARQCRRNSTLAPVATITSCSGVKNNNNRAGHAARISRKEIHYVLFKKHKLLDVGYLFSFTFLSWEPTFRFSRFGYMTSTISAKVIRILFLPLLLCYRYYSNRCLRLFSDKLGLRKYLLWIITGMLVMLRRYLFLSSGHCYNTTF
ncbi:hypothetical protein [Enterobacter hormaechei]